MKFGCGGAGQPRRGSAPAQAGSERRLRWRVATAVPMAGEGPARIHRSFSNRLSPNGLNSEKERGPWPSCPLRKVAPYNPPRKGLAESLGARVQFYGGPK